MDADTLVKKAKQSIKSGDYDLAKDYLKEAAAEAPLRTDIREMLEFVIHRGASTQKRKSPGKQPRGLFKMDRDQPAPQEGLFASSAPRKHSSWMMTIVTFGLIALVGAGSVTAYLLSRPGIKGGAPAASDTSSAGDSTTSGTASITPETAGSSDVLSNVDSLLVQSKYQEALDALQKNLALNPDNKEVLKQKLADVQFQYGKDLFEKSQYDEAIENLQSAAETNKTPEVLSWLGQAYLDRAKKEQSTDARARERDLEEAERVLKESISLDSDIKRSYLSLGRTYSAQARPDKAADIYNQLIQKWPDSNEAAHAKRDLTMMDLKQL